MAHFEMRQTPDGRIEFQGYISIHEMANLRLDGIERQVVNSPAETSADMLQSLEIIFRRLSEQNGKTADPAWRGCYK